MFVGPVFFREATTTPRRVNHYVFRSVYSIALLLLIITAWLVVTGTQVIRNVGDMARFGGMLFELLAPLQLVLVMFMAALSAASSVSQEKDRRTLILLLMTRLNNSELVLGKLLASLLNVLTMIAAAVPVFWMITLFGGVSGNQVMTVLAITVVTAAAAGSLGAVLALWREKTFQALAMTVLGLVLWLGLGETPLLVGDVAGVPAESSAVALSPLRAVMEASRPATGFSGEAGRAALTAFFLLTALSTTSIVSCGIVMVRVWNPSRAARPGRSAEQRESGAAGGRTAAIEPAHGAEPGTAEVATTERSSPRAAAPHREVWDNPVLWREICTWAYGRKVAVIKVCYCLVFAATLFGVSRSLTVATTGDDAMTSLVPVSARPLAPFFLLSLVMINAMAVTSITNERDGQALDLLLVTDLTPKEFVLGKLGGVLWVSREMVVLPLLAGFYLWWKGGITTENLVFVSLGLGIMDVFVSMLGVHCGMIYANSRTAIGVSLGVVFFLFLGIVTCMVIMVSFSGSFRTQLAPFVAFILGGTIGLALSLGYRNLSRAIWLASLILPFATFYAITSFVLGNRELWVFLVSAVAYGFTTAAMMVPAIGEFDIAMGRTKTAEDD